MNYKNIGASEIKISEITFGCWSIIGDANWGEQKEKDSIQAIHAAIDYGINFFDTAPVYGDGKSEEILAKAFQGRRSEVLIASKILGTLSKERIIQGCEESLKRLQTDTIDLFQLHWPDWETPIDESLSAMEQLKQAGKIRLYGVSNFGEKDLTEALEYGHIASNEIAYNLLWRGPEQKVLPLCELNNVSVLCYSSLMQGLLTGKFHSADDVPVGRARTLHFSKERPHARHGKEGFEKETFDTLEVLRKICERYGFSMVAAAMQWLLNQSAVTSIITGARSSQQIEEQVKALEEKIDLAILEEITQATDFLKERLGSNLDLWADISRIR